MSFAADCKQELCMIENKRACCLKAECYGLLLFSKCFSARESQMVCENAAVARRVAEAAAVSAGVYAEVRSQLRRKNIGAYAITIPGEAARIQMIRSFGHDENDVNLHIHEKNLQKDCCISAFLRGVFLICGTVTDPQKEYNLEFLTARTNLARDFEALLAEHEFAPHRTRRNGVNLVYVKNSANLERLLRFMGAAGAAEEIHAQKAFKQVRNQTNRQTNCDTANLGKTARANAQTLRAIRYLQENDALETLPEVLQQAAAVRLQYPDLSLTALCGCFDPAVSKSGLSHRMKKLEALADALRQRMEKGQEAEP